MSAILPWLRHPYLCPIVAILAGSLVTFSLAPYHLWPLGMISVGLLACLNYKTSVKHQFLISFLYGLGLYGFGASWVFISINEFGSTSLLLSLLLTAAFVSFLAFVFALPFLLFAKLFRHTSLIYLIGFPAVWVLNEWFRSWVLTGFPWLYLGYAHIHSPLSGWAPIFGIFGISLFTTFSACIPLLLIMRPQFPEWSKLSFSRWSILLLLIWSTGFGLSKVSWTEQDVEAIDVGMAQGNIPQEKKWLPSFLDETYDIFSTLTEPLWALDWVIWPEAAIPLLHSYAAEDLAKLDAQASATNTVFITGILYDDRANAKYYNSIIAKGLGEGITFKTRLVPFGEYVPLEKWLRGTIEFFNLPTSILHIGPDRPDGLNANGLKISPYICYEVVYPDLVAGRAKDSAVLLTVSNDAWFGQSIGPIQHLQMVQMRALETQRYFIRSTNNGISAFINDKGDIINQGGRATREAIIGKVYATTGSTPFMVWRSWPVVVICFTLLFFLWIREKKYKFTAELP